MGVLTLLFTKVFTWFSSSSLRGHKGACVEMGRDGVNAPVEVFFLHFTARCRVQCVNANSGFRSQQEQSWAGADLTCCLWPDTYGSDFFCAGAMIPPESCFLMVARGGRRADTEELLALLMSHTLDISNSAKLWGFYFHRKGMFPTLP